MTKALEALEGLYEAANGCGNLDEWQIDQAYKLLRQELEWQDISTAPKDGTWIKVRGSDGDEHKVKYRKNKVNDHCWYKGNGVYLNQNFLTDWVHLPPPPQGENE